MNTACKIETRSPLPALDAPLPPVIESMNSADNTTGPDRQVLRKMIRIADIDLSASTQVRASMQDEVVTDYAERLLAGDEFPPILILHDGKIYRIADGFHRVAGANRAGREEIDAEIRIGGRREALTAALGANMQHGLRRSNADKRRAVEIALKEFHNLSDRAIAEMCGVGNQLVGEVRKELCDSHSSTPRIGRDGKRRKARANPKQKDRTGNKQVMKRRGGKADAQPQTDSDDKNAENKPHEPTQPTEDDKRENTDEDVQPFNLADGTELPADAIGQGWVTVDDVAIKVRIIASIAKPTTSMEKKWCTRYQRLFIGVASVLNREVGSEPSLEDLQNVEGSLTDLRNLAVTLSRSKRPS